MISSLFGVAAAKVNSLSETIQSLNPTETLENALKPPNGVPSTVTSTPTPNSRIPQPSPTAKVQSPAQPPNNRPLAPSANINNSNRSASVPPSNRRSLQTPQGDRSASPVPPTRALTPTERLKTDDDIPLPDLSGLSAEEQRKILEVLERQSDETASEQQIVERQRQDLERLEKDVKLLEEQSRSMGIPDGSVCQICFRIKFEPVSASTPAGHRCHSCQLKFCASCGQKTQLHTQKLAWQCKLCRKRADILAKSGKWATPAAAVAVKDANTTADLSGNATTVSGDSTTSSVNSSNNGYPLSAKFAHQNVAPQIADASLKQPSAQPYASPGHNVPNNPGLAVSSGYATAATDVKRSDHPSNSTAVNKGGTTQNANANGNVIHEQSHSQQKESQSPFSQLARFIPNVIDTITHPTSSDSNKHTSDPSLNKHKTNQPQSGSNANVHSLANQKGALFASNGNMVNMTGMPSEPPPLPPPRTPQPNDKQGPPGRRSVSGRGQPRSRGGVANNIAPPRRSAPAPPDHKDVSGRGLPGRALYPANGSVNQYQGYQPPGRADELPDSGYRSESNRTSASRESAEKRRRATGNGDYSGYVSGGSRKQNQMMQKMDSMNSEYSYYMDQDNPYPSQLDRAYPDDQQPGLPKGSGYPIDTRSKPRLRSGRRRDQHFYTTGSARSFSSSEEDLRSTPDLTSWDGFESESLISERGLDWEDFGPGKFSSSGPQRSWRGATSIDWSPNSDGSVIGRVLLSKGAGRELGLKVRGGQALDQVLQSGSGSANAELSDLEVTANRGLLGAFVVNVRRGSLADTVAGILPGDEVLEWNKIVFRDLTHTQVTQVIMQSKQDAEVELVICRRPHMHLKGARPTMSDQSGVVYPPRPTTRRGELATGAAGAQMDREHPDASSVGVGARMGTAGGAVGNAMVGGTDNTSSSSSALSYSLPASSMATAFRLNQSSNQMQSSQPHPVTSECVSGQVQIQLSYNDKETELRVKLGQAVDLISREDGHPRNPYAKLYILPDRREEQTLRRSTTCYNTLEPIWNQSFSFYLTRTQLVERELEVTIWDNCFANNSSELHLQQSSTLPLNNAVKEFLGEVLLSLDQVAFDGEMRWYDLHVHDSSSSHSLPIPSPPPGRQKKNEPHSLHPPLDYSISQGNGADRSRQSHGFWNSSEQPLDNARHGMRGDNQKGATAPNTPMRSSDIDSSAGYYSPYNKSNPSSRVRHSQDYLSLSQPASSHLRRTPLASRGHSDLDFYEASSRSGGQGQRSRSSKGYMSGYHSAGESYHYVTGSDYGDGDPDSLYLTDVESRRRRGSRSSYDGWNSSRYNERSPTHFSDIESGGRRRRELSSTAAAYSSRYAPARSTGAPSPLSSTAQDHFLGENGSFPRSHPDTRNVGGSSAAVAHKFYSSAINNRQQLPPKQHQQQLPSTAVTSLATAAHYMPSPLMSHPTHPSTGGSSSSAAADHVYRFRRYRGGPTSRVRQYSRTNNMQLPPPHLASGGGIDSWRNGANMSPVERLWHSDAEGGDISAEYEDNNYILATRYNLPPPRRRSPNSSGLSTPTQSFLLNKEGISEHSSTPRADMFSPSNPDGNGLMRRQSSVQNPPASPPGRNASLRRQISDALSYFDAQELIDNEQDLDYFTQSDATHLRYNRYEQESNPLRDMKGRHRDSCGSSRFGDESSFDSPSSRVAQKNSDMMDDANNYVNDPRLVSNAPASRRDDAKEMSFYRDRDEQKYLEGDYYQTRKNSSEKGASRYNKADKSAIDSSRSSKRRGDFDCDHELPADDQRIASREDEASWRDRGDAYVSRSEGRGSSDKHRGDFKQPQDNMRSLEDEEEEDDIEMEFRRTAVADTFNEVDKGMPNDEDDDDDIDDWLLEQSKKYGVKMEQVERSEEPEHILSASMPMGADAGFFSDTGGGNKKRRPSIGHKIGALVGLSKKSNSLTQLQDVRNKRISIPRTAEVGFHTHDDMKKYLLSRMDNHSLHSSSASTGATSMDVQMYLQSQYATPVTEQLNSFVEDLGPGQVVGRQVLGSPCLGEIQLSIGLKRNTCLEVEIVRARNLSVRPMSKIFPAAFVKVYLMEGKKCCGKAKTKIARRTTDPYFQQQLTFNAVPTGRTLQVTVWGDYGRMERKCFMGVAQINLDDINLSNIVIGWYKLFTSSSLVEPKSSQVSLQQAGQFGPF